MNTLIFPLLILLTPILTLRFVLRRLSKKNVISVSLKVALGLVFAAAGIMATFLAMLVSISGMSEKGITCMTGVVAFIPLGLLVNVVGVPLLLFLSKSMTNKDVRSISKT